MRTIPLAVLLSLSLASCSSSANPFTGPDIEPGRLQEPPDRPSPIVPPPVEGSTAPCELPEARPWSGTWDSLRMMSITTAGCPPVGPSA